MVVEKLTPSLSMLFKVNPKLLKLVSPEPGALERAGEKALPSLPSSLPAPSLPYSPHVPKILVVKHLGLLLKLEIGAVYKLA